VSCFGLNDAIIAANATGGTPPYIFSWNNGTVNDTLFNIAAGNYTVFISDSLNCDTSINITVSQPDSIIISIPQYVEKCLYDTIDIQPIIRGGVPDYKYYWNSILGPNKKLITDHYDTTYMLYVIDSNNCKSADYTINIRIYEGMNINISAVANDSICYGDSVRINIIAIGGSGKYVYLWDDNIITSYNSRTFYITENRKYKITVKDYCTYDIVDSIEIVVLPSPYIVIKPEGAYGCSPVTVTFGTIDSLTPYSYNITSYKWNFGDNSTSEEPTPVHVFNNPGKYKVSLETKIDIGCKNLYTTNNYVEVYTNPIADFSYTPTEPEIGLPGVKFINKSVGANYWLWIFDDTISGINNYSTTYNPTHIYEKTGYYNVMLFVRNVNGCMDSTIKTIRVSEFYRFFAPNAITPDGDGLNDYFMPIMTGIDENDFQMYIFSRWGEIIYKTTSIYKPWDGHAKGGKEIVPNGVYVWLVIVRDINGNMHKHIGHVSVIR